VTAVAAKLGDNIDILGIVDLSHFSRSRVLFKGCIEGINFTHSHSNGKSPALSVLFSFLVRYQ
jgi:hypothetical protein